MTRLFCRNEGLSAPDTAFDHRIHKDSPTFERAKRLASAIQRKRRRAGLPAISERAAWSMAQRIIRDAQHEKARLDEMARRKEARLIARAEGRTRWIPIERKPPLESRLEDARRRHIEREAKEFLSFACANA